ncbi:ProQ/FINO family protein [Rhodoferax sp.]|uniref:ProQ/FINO family protein n=1 Tax=Rhodoferax sp. TaxID=50421 RepID=UPI0025CE3D22|nr:ProQ/FINO family protein [Rhodoferax sp.]
MTTPLAPNTKTSKPRAPKQQHAPHIREVHPLLHKLYDLYPKLFGAQALPLKLGIFHELVANHPDLLEAKALREALGQHTRSTRYLEQVATGVQRHDLQGNPVETLAPEHVHQAIMEVARRDRAGNSPAAQAKLRMRLRNAFEASGLSRSAYAEQVKPPLEAWNALLDHAYTEDGAAAAKREALLKAFESSGQTLMQFADMYGMDQASTESSLEQAKQDRATKQAE